jgi:hypothetical protein
MAQPIQAVPDRPTLHQLPDLSQLPASLAPLVAMPRWVSWLYAWKGSKWTKEPRGKGGSKQWGGMRHWMTHAQAVAQMRNSGHDGIGFVLSEDCEIVGIDLDKCIRYENGERIVSPWAAAIIKKAEAKGAYTEVTVSDTGARIIGRTARQVSIHCQIKGEELADGSLGVISGARTGPEFEIYCRPTNQYMTVSGMDCEGDPLTPVDDIVDEILQHYPQPVKPAAVVSESDWRINPDAGPGVVDADTISRIIGPLSPHDAADKSAAFHGVVSDLFYANHSVTDICELMEGQADGVAHRFGAEGRLLKMVEKSFDKIRGEFEAEKTKCGSTLGRSAPPPPVASMPSTGGSAPQGAAASAAAAAMLQATQAPPGDSDDAAESHASLELKINELNAQYFVVKIGGKTLVGEFVTAQGTQHQVLSLQATEAFNTWLANRKIAVRDQTPAMYVRSRSERCGWNTGDAASMRAWIWSQADRTSCRTAISTYGAVSACSRNRASGR